ncbi:alkene reductase [Burkholderia plantarii]|uniref:N-ethylmaleimide reductase NemA n=1 Tax=Burkholderia plantarii TaxID=41899 RepID=A0A0B6SC54_BURPL|nr:alkene reductase [Burkholderia plantarii]AJK49826.1 N-ethylmaleimide reductase NemA [Burkholderia plantarii]
MPTLFTPIQLGRYALKHRVVHAPVTRLRSDPDDTPSAMMVEYYRQRASDGGLLISESSHTLRSGRGYLGGPGIYEDRHIAGWKKIADAVHEKGGRIFMQIVHDGRQSHVDLTGGTPPVAPSVVPFETRVLTARGWVPNSPHRAADIEEVRLLIDAYRTAAERALEAGVDGVELHSANGYLADTFLQDGTNTRTDDYGGSIEKRARFTLEAARGMISVFGADRVGVRLSPSGKWGAMSDSSPQDTFRYVVRQLDSMGLAYLHLIEPRVMGVETLDDKAGPVASEYLRQFFNGPILSAGGYDREGANAALRSGHADLIAFGRYFTSNPDLPERLRLNLPLADYDRSAFWGGDEHGYIDFPAYGAARVE